VLAVVGLVLVVSVVVLIATDPFGGSTNSARGVGDNATAISFASVTRQMLSSQTQVSGTLGYASSSSIRVPSGTAPSAVAQAQQSVADAQGVLSTASASLADDSETLAGGRATLSAARAKEAVDCAGDGAAESASGGPGLCASDAQAVSAAEQNSSAAATRVGGDRAQVSSAERSLASSEASLASARSSAAVYGQSSTFTKLPSAGQVIKRGESLYEINGQPMLLLYGSVFPTRAFTAGMPAGSEVAELNANLDALGFGQGLTGDRFTEGTAAAIRALQSAHGLGVTGELLLGSVVFQPGPVRVSSVTPAVGQAVMPGPVLGITSTSPQVRSRSTQPSSPASRSVTRSRSPCRTTRPRPDGSRMSRASPRRRRANLAVVVKKKARRRSKSTSLRPILRRRATWTRRP
jgi:hypothetical protein